MKTYSGVEVGIWSTGGVAGVTNTVVTGTGDDFNGTFSGGLFNNASDDGDGTNAVIPDWALTFTDAAGGDFTLLSGNSIYQAGVDDPGGAVQDDTDIAGTAWVSPWGIGAFSYSASAGGSSAIKPKLIVIMQ